MFLRREGEVQLGDPVWRLGRVTATELSADGLVRVAEIEYKNNDESVLRKTRRAVRRIAVLHHEGDLELVDQLNEASKKACREFVANIKKKH